MFIRTRRRVRLGYCWDSPNRGEVVTYYQAVESYRDQQGRPRHRTLVGWNDWSDGTTIAEAIAACEKRIASLRGDVASLRKDISRFVVEWHPGMRRHRYICEREAHKAEQWLARQEARLLALREVERAKVGPAVVPP